MSLKSQIRSDLTAAMKAKDSDTTATLRMVLAAIQTAEVAGKEAHELSDDETVKVLQKESKKRAEAAEVFADNGRAELAAKEQAEAAIIDRYLPTPLSDDELTTLAAQAVSDVTAQLGEAPTMKQMGQVMAAATKAAEGRADGKRLSAAVRAALSA
ncbi:GatB/YqeY domain-containing protein [Jongsikchunia kroppenstedtii]|uniref:GatB/YqeY domain-containing protein n=1 Tax=Jongsikchunia kroppenstedtii TaxID=1121721 RepID=UPI00035C61D2|nr:GatB/YqeY domain-containing protein [Jongsikchunia kroppenstedtii]